MQSEGETFEDDCLRHLGEREKALALIEESLSYDHFNFGCCFEKYLMTEDEKDLHSLLLQMRREGHNYEELALDYASCGCWEEAIKVVDVAIDFQYCNLLYCITIKAGSCTN